MGVFFVVKIRTRAETSGDMCGNLRMDVLVGCQERLLRSPRYVQAAESVFEGRRCFQSVELVNWKHGQDCGFEVGSPATVSHSHRLNSQPPINYTAMIM